MAPLPHAYQLCKSLLRHLCSTLKNKNSEQPPRPSPIIRHAGVPIGFYLRGESRWADKFHGNTCTPPTRNFVFCRLDVKTFLQLSCLCLFNHCVIIVTVTTTIAIATITIIVLTTITVMITAIFIVIIFLSLDFYFQSAHSADFVSQSFAFPLPCFVFPNMFLIFTFNPISIKKKKLFSWMQTCFQSHQHCSAIHQLHFSLLRWSGHLIKLEAPSWRSCGHGQLGEDPELTGGIIYVSHLAWMLRDPPGGSGEMLLGRRTSGTPGLARCLRRGLIPVRANITVGLPQFLVENKKKVAERTQSWKTNSVSSAYLFRWCENS